MLKKAMESNLRGELTDLPASAQLSKMVTFQSRL